MGTPVFGVGQGYFKVVSSPLVASIAGGSKVARGLSRPLIFDASMSYDPDEEDNKLLGWWLNNIFFLIPECVSYSDVKSFIYFEDQHLKS